LSIWAKEKPKGDVRCRGVAVAVWGEMVLFLITALAMLAFAANSVLNRMAVGGGLIDPVTYAVIRLAAGAAMLALLVLARRILQGGAVWPGLQGRLAGVAGLLAYLFCFSTAYLTLDAGIGALILFGSVQITMFGGALVAQEAVPSSRWAGAGLAFVGLLVLVAPGGNIGAIGPVLAMAGAGVGWGVYSLAGRRAVDPLLATAANFVLALPLAAGAGMVIGFSGATQPLGVWLAILSGAVTSGLGYALWYGVLPKLGAARAGVAQLTVPLIAAGAGAVWLGEGVSLRFAVASALVLGGVALASFVRR
jgi:drug/metabolite transporter (DMT)-like permease